MLDFAGCDGHTRLAMGIQVKICGINSVEAADACVRAGADFAGLVFHKDSPRNLTIDQGRMLAERMRGRVRLVVLVADEGDAGIGAVVAALRPDFLQLDGDATPQRAVAVRARFAVPVITAIAIADASDFAGVAAFETVADMLLFDARAPLGAARPGGHGAAFDWQLIRGRTFSRPWLLAGGLNAGNVGRAIQSTGAPGVDVSSGVEITPGVKSAALIGEFVQAARSTRLAESRA